MFARIGSSSWGRSLLGWIAVSLGLAAAGCAASPRDAALADAAAFSQARDWPQAERAYDQALALDPDDAKALAGRAAARRAWRKAQVEAAVEATRRGAYGRALASLERAERLTSTPDPALERARTELASRVGQSARRAVDGDMPAVALIRLAAVAPLVEESAPLRDVRRRAGRALRAAARLQVALRVKGEMPGLEAEIREAAKERPFADPGGAAEETKVAVGAPRFEALPQKTRDERCVFRCRIEARANPAHAAQLVEVDRGRAALAEAARVGRRHRETVARARTERDAAVDREAGVEADLTAARARLHDCVRRWPPNRSSPCPAQERDVAAAERRQSPAQAARKRAEATLRAAVDAARPVQAAWTRARREDEAARARLARIPRTLRQSEKCEVSYPVQIDERVARVAVTIDGELVSIEVRRQASSRPAVAAYIALSDQGDGACERLARPLAERVASDEELRVTLRGRVANAVMERLRAQRDERKQAALSRAAHAQGDEQLEWWGRAVALGASPPRPDGVAPVAVKWLAGAAR